MQEIVDHHINFADIKPMVENQAIKLNHVIPELALTSHQT